MLRLMTHLSLLAGAHAYQSAAGRLPAIESRVFLCRSAMFGGMKLGAAVDAAGDYLAKPAPPAQVCGIPFAPSTSLPSRRALLLGALGTAVAVGNAKPASAGSFNAASTDQASDQVTVGLEGDNFSSYSSAKPDLEGGSKQLVSWKFKGTVPRVNIWLRREQFGPSSLSALLANGVENTGSCVVTIPSGSGPGTYFLQIKSVTDDRVYEWSRKFTIDKTATPAVIYDVVAKPQPPSMPPTQRGKVKKSLVPGASY